MLSYYMTHTSYLYYIYAAVVIGFSNDNSSVTIVEGDPAQTICLEVKEEGLMLDPFDAFVINVEIDPDIPGGVS